MDGEWMCVELTHFCVHFYFHGPEPAVSANTAQLHLSHTSLTYPAVRSVPNCWTEKCVWTICPRSLPGSAL